MNPIRHTYISQYMTDNPQNAPDWNTSCILNDNAVNNQAVHTNKNGRMAKNNAILTDFFMLFKILIGDKIVPSATQM